jgi:hypothetical protein
MWDAYQVILNTKFSEAGFAIDSAFHPLTSWNGSGLADLSNFYQDKMRKVKTVADPVTKPAEEMTPAESNTYDNRMADRYIWLRREVRMLWSWLSRQQFYGFARTDVAPTSPVRVKLSMSLKYRAIQFRFHDNTVSVIPWTGDAPQTPDQRASWREPAPAKFEGRTAEFEMIARPKAKAQARIQRSLSVLNSPDVYAYEKATGRKFKPPVVATNRKRRVPEPTADDFDGESGANPKIPLTESLRQHIQDSMEQENDLEKVLAETRLQQEEEEENNESGGTRGDASSHNNDGHMAVEPRNVRAAMPEHHDMLANSSSHVLGPVSLSLPIRTAVNPPVGGSPIPPSAYILYSSDFPDISDRSHSGALLTNGLFETFVSTTSSGYLTLNSTPANNETSTVTLAESDEWLIKIRSYELGISSVTATVSLINSTANVTDLTVSITQLGMNLKFSASSALHASNGMDNTNVFSSDCLAQYSMLTVGLVPPSPQGNGNLKFSTVMEAFAPEFLRTATELLPLPGFKDFDADLVLDDGKGDRSLLTFSPDRGYNSWLRLQFSLKNESAFESHFKDVFGSVIGANLTITNVKIVGKMRSSSYVDDTGLTVIVEKDIIFQAQLKIGSSQDPLDIFVIFGPAMTKLVVRFGDGHTSVPEGLISGNNISDDHKDPSGLLPDTGILSLREIAVSVNNPTSESKFGFNALSVQFEVDLFDSVFFATIQGSKQSQSFRVQLWTEDPPGDEHLILASFEITDAYPPPKNLPCSVHLSKLIPGVSDPKIGIALDITAAEFLCRRRSDEIDIDFMGVIECYPADTDVPSPDFGTMTLSGQYVRARNGSAISTSWNILFQSQILLLPRSSAYDPAELDISASYESETSTWLIDFKATGIGFATIYDLLDSSVNDDVMDMLEHFDIPLLEVAYQYTPDTSKFMATGTLRICDLDLDILYTYEKAKGDDASAMWSFEAALGSIKTDYKLVDFIFHFDPDPSSELVDALHAVPFIRDIELPNTGGTWEGLDLNDENPSLPENAPVFFKVAKTNKSLTIWFRIEVDTPVGAISVMFVQYKPLGGSTKGDNEAIGADGNPEPTIAKPAVKRIVRVRLDRLPQLPSIPVVGSIQQPVDSIDYVYVQDTVATAQKLPTAGFTTSEIEDINSVSSPLQHFRFKRKNRSSLTIFQAILDSTKKIKYREPKASSIGTSGATPTANTKPEYVLLEGHHFLVVTDGKVALDHVFGKPSKGTPPPLQTGLQGLNNHATGKLLVRAGVAKPMVNELKTTTTTESASKEDSGATMGTNKKSFGSFTISNVSGIYTSIPRMYSDTSLGWHSSQK